MTSRALLLLLAACSGSTTAPEAPPPEPPEAEPPPPPRATGPSLVIVTLDTTRADHIGAYGYDKAQTPVVDALAAAGVRFERAYATVPLTTPSHASILTGLYPPRHGIHNNGDAILPEEAVTLAERLHDAGYDTAAAVSAFVTTRVWNLDQGFDTYLDAIQTRGGGSRWGQERPADQVVDDLIAWAAAREDPSRPFFVWAHFYDAHHPYAPPAPYDTALEHPYDGEIAFVDAQIGRLKATLDAQPVPGGTAWMILADHGESLDGSHGEQTHGMFVFDPTMRVPFIFRPAQPLAAPVVAKAPTVSLVDVTPTALGLLGLPVPAGMDGQDLSGAARGEVPTREAVYMESLTPQQRFGYHPEIATAEGSLKLMDTPSPRLFDVAADPGELENRIDTTDPAVIARLRGVAQRVWASPPIVAGAGAAASPEVLEQLAALGYVSNDFEHGDAVSSIDAKDRIDVIARIESIREQVRDSRDAAATEAAYRALLLDEPSLGEARMGLARALGAQGKHAEAVQTYRDALEQQPSSVVLRVNLANALAAAGQHEAGLAEMMAALEQLPGDSLAQTGALRMLTDLDREEEGIRLARQWLAEKPGDPALQAHLGVMLAQEGKLEEAEPLLRESLRDDVPRQLVARTLAVIETTKGHPKRALWFYRKELEAFPNPEVRLKAAQLHMVLHEWSDAAEQFSLYVDKTPGPEGLGVRTPWAQATFNLGEYAQAKEILAPVLRARPDDPDVLLLQANILAKIGDRAEAEALAARANELNRLRVEALRARDASSSSGGGGPRGPGGPPPGAAPGSAPPPAP